MFGILSGTQQCLLFTPFDPSQSENRTSWVVIIIITCTRLVFACTACRYQGQCRFKYHHNFLHQDMNPPTQNCTFSSTERLIVKSTSLKYTPAICIIEPCSPSPGMHKMHSYVTSWFTTRLTCVAGGSDVRTAAELAAWAARYSWRWRSLQYQPQQHRPEVGFHDLIRSG